MKNTKFKVVGDPNNQSRFSSKIITDSLNEAAKSLGIYSDDALTVVYDGCCNHHGYNPDAIICTYEISFPNILTQNANGKPILGVSRDNLNFIIKGNYNKDLAGYFPLGVDSNLYPKVEKTKNLSQFTVGVYTESLIRGGIELCLQSFAKAFSGNSDCKLLIKDRNATERFQQFVRYFAEKNNILVDYQNLHFNTIGQITDWFSGVDCHLYMNRSSTWAMPPLESMTMGVPTLAVAYSGPREYIFDEETGIEIPFSEEGINADFPMLTEIGCRNFFFLSGYSSQPTWAVGNTEKAAEKLIKLKNNKQLRDKISIQGREYAIKNLSWQNSALKLQEQLTRWYK
jgi:glycosyltransferase involved in cell wall biosynthesis